MKTTVAFTMGLMFVSGAFGDASFRPGIIWPDDRGVAINAHGGGVLFDNGTYYWFGEHKVAGSDGNFAQVGVHVYESRDLYQWRDEGIALAVSTNPASDIVKGCILERPKVLRCPQTGKYVMYFHLELKGQGYRAARTGIAVADTPTGPYRFLRSLRPNAKQWPINVRPEQKTPAAIAAAKKAIAAHDTSAPIDYFAAHFNDGQMSRDMTLFLDSDGKAYHLFASEENRTVHIAELTDDFLDYTGLYARAFVDTLTEAVAICKREGVYYLLGSGCTGWAPNQARLFRAKNIFGPWESLGNPCKGVNPQNHLGPEKTWGGQSTFILPVAGRPDLFIALFDIWRPKNAIDGRYVWLPIDFKPDGQVEIVWKDAWRLP